MKFSLYLENIAAQVIIVNGGLRETQSLLRIIDSFGGSTPLENLSLFLHSTVITSSIKYEKAWSETLLFCGCGRWMTPLLLMT